MKLIFFTHPSFLLSQSMPRFANMLAKGMQDKGHHVEVWSPQEYFYKLPVPQFAKKWMGYLDQYLIFPLKVKERLKMVQKNTLFVFTDQALGPWVPLVSALPHVIHCHDFLAQRSAAGEIPQNKTGKSGQQYQAYIRRGYRKGKNFISVSQKTQNDLHHFLGFVPHVSAVVYNGMNRNLKAEDTLAARRNLSIQIKTDLLQGYLLHVGGNQWYKNRRGVIKIYNAWRKKNPIHLPLLMVGAPPNASLEMDRSNSFYAQDIYFLSGLNDASVQLAYSGASLFLYPSLAEGFGWPIAEAMGAGCPVVTTGEAPMTEVGGKAAIYIPTEPVAEEEKSRWADECAYTMTQVLSLTTEQKQILIQQGLTNIIRFDTNMALHRIEAIYQKVAGNNPI